MFHKAGAIRIRKSKAFTNSKAYSSTKNSRFWYKNFIFLERIAKLYYKNCVFVPKTTVIRSKKQSFLE
jgi:hypothetical protein